MITIEIIEYVEHAGHSPFEDWFNELHSQAAVKVTNALYRLEHGNFSNVKSVGNGVFEYKIDFGPGYRIYFGQERDVLIILLGGGSKKRQDLDIRAATMHWQRYKKIKETSHGTHPKF